MRCAYTGVVTPALRRVDGSAVESQSGAEHRFVVERKMPTAVRPLRREKPSAAYGVGAIMIKHTNSFALTFLSGDHNGGAVFPAEDRGNHNGSCWPKISDPGAGRGTDTWKP
jgi:hypothetical protein